MFYISRNMIASDTMSLSAMIIFTVCLMVLGAFALSLSLVSKILRRERMRLPGGLHVRHDPKDARFEIVAVHGLSANPEYTWSCKAESPGSVGNSRVHFLDLLAERFPNARIMNFAHSSDWLLDTSFSTVQETGMTLSRHLVIHREKTPSRLPIVFIGHSFGGIVIKEALDWLANKDRWGSNEEWYATNIVESIRGIMFLGTPHRGSPLAVWASLLARATSIFGSEIALLYLLSQDSGPLSDIADRFEKIQKRLDQATIFSFYEQKKTYLGFLPIGKIVGKESARGLSGKLIPINTDHSGLNKCRSSSGQVFQEISTAVETMTSLPLSLHRADRWILDRYANDHRLWIQRISGERLHMDSCYVNFNVVKQNVRNGQNVDHVQPPSLDFSVAERLRRSQFRERWQPSDEKPIHLPDLLNPCKFSPEKNKRRPRRILIRGRAGVGKSTLCKKVIGDFLQLQRARKYMRDDSNDLKDAHEYSYCSQFARILWVPLGNLATREDRDFWEWLLGMYFAPMRNPEAKPMLKALRLHLQSHYTEDDTLFLLDGMDEIAARLQDGSTLKETVDWLLGQRNVIVTSRPSVKFDQSQPRETFDIEYETIGFYQNQVEDYVAKVEQPHAADILEFLKTRPLIQDLVRIPVQLDALCFAWKDAASRNMNRQFVLETMTGLYQAIDGALWRKDSGRLDRTSESDTPLPWEIERIMKGEIILLENLAFHGLCEGLTVFDEDFLGRVFQELQEELQPREGLDHTLQRLSFLRSPEVSPGQTKRNYYFLHLTHQEYFAARHLKRQWVKRNAEGVNAVDFFRGHKYSERFDLVWRFLSGLLGSHDDDKYSQTGARTKHEHRPTPLVSSQLERYFEEIRQEPLDMLGPTHQRLVMHCLYEVPTSRSLPTRKTLEKQLENWLLFEYDFIRENPLFYRWYFDDYRWLRNNIEYPEHIIGRLLTGGDNNRKTWLLQSLKLRRAKSAEVVSLITNWIEQKHGPVLVASISMFETFPETSFSGRVIRIVLGKLDDTDSSVRHEASMIVQRMKNSPALSQLALEEMVRSLDSHYDSCIKTRVLDDHHAALLQTDLKLIHTFISQPSENLLLKVARVITNLPQNLYAPKETNRQKRIQKAAMDILFAKQVSLPPGVSDTLVNWAQNIDSLLHEDISRILGQQPALLSHLMRNTMQKFESDDPNLRSIAIDVLNSQSALPEAISIELLQIFMTAVEGFDLKQLHKQNVVLNILKRQIKLQETVLYVLVQLISTGDSTAKICARSILQNQSELSGTILDMLARSFETEDIRYQRETGRIFRLRSSLPETTVHIIARGLQHENPDIQETALGALPRGQYLPDDMLRRVVDLLRSQHLKVVDSALIVLQSCRNLHIISDQISCLLRDKNRSTLATAFKIFEHQEPSNEILTQIDLLTEDEDPCIRGLALKIFLRSLGGSKRLDKIEVMLGDVDQSIRKYALETVIVNQLFDELSDAALDQVAQLLGVCTGVRFDAVLEGAKRLTPKLIQFTVEMLEVEEPKIRARTLRALTNMKHLPQVIIDVIQRKLRDSEPYVRSAAMYQVCARQDLFPLVVEVLKKGFQGEDLFYMSKAIECYLSQQSPPESLLPFVLQTLNSMTDGSELCARALLAREGGARLDAFLLFRVADTFQSDQSMSLLELMAHDIGNGGSSIGDFFQRLARQKFRFPVEILRIMLQKLDVAMQKPEDDNEPDGYWHRRPEFDIIDAIDDWPKNMFYQTMAKNLLNGPKGLRKHILFQLSRQPSLPDFVLIRIAAMFRETPASFRPSLLAIVLKHPELATICVSEGTFPGFYRFLLQESFNGHLVWLHQSDDSDRSSEQSQGCYQTMGMDVKNELVKARQNILGPDLA